MPHHHPHHHHHHHRPRPKHHRSNRDRVLEAVDLLRQTRKINTVEELIGSLKEMGEPEMVEFVGELQRGMGTRSLDIDTAIIANRAHALTAARDEHDGLVASVSHLPYLISVALIRHLGNERSWRETASLAAGGFAYTTHLADSDPQMFADIMRTNRDNIVRRLDLYIDELSALREAIAGDDPGLKDQFTRAQGLHQDWLAGRAQGQASEGENPLPTTRSMLTGSLFGRFGRADRDKEK